MNCGSRETIKNNPVTPSRSPVFEVPLLQLAQLVADNVSQGYVHAGIIVAFCHLPIALCLFRFNFFHT